ncbi:transposase [Roseiarcus sp.]|uniref:transposase n=1 Tax=Roseiarcus sp. TaxID=1969460 RepID=UPI003C721B5D
MLRTRHQPKEISATLRQVDALTSHGQSVADAIRAVGVPEVTYYRWRREFDGLQSDQVKRPGQLQAENARLRRIVSDLKLDKLILAEVAQGIY